MTDTRFTVFDPEMKSSLGNEPVPKQITHDNTSAFWEYFQKTFHIASRKRRRRKKRDIPRVSTKNT